MFDYFSEIKNSAFFLAIVVPEIKQIKQIKRGQTSAAGAPAWRDPSFGRAMRSTGHEIKRL